MSVDSAFTVEYSKSDRSNCIACRSTIKKNTIRFGIIVQSPNFDGKILRWHHKKCFCKKVKLYDVQMIKGFESLRWKDQERIRQQIEGNSTEKKNETVRKDAFAVQYKKSNSNKCHACDSAIETDTLCLAKKNGTTISSEPNEQSDVWYHINCFNEIKHDLEFSGTAESFSGFANLKEEDQMELRQKLASPTVSNRKRKSETDETDDATIVKQPKLEDEIQIKKEQSELLWTYKDALRKEIPRDVLKQLLEFNLQKLVSGEYNLIETVADCMAFGALEHCPECGGFIIFNYTTYKCTGNITEWTKCMYSTQSPNRKPFEIPVDVKQQYNILPKYNPKFPLKGYSIVLAGRLSKTAATLQQEIERLGAKVLANVDATVDVVISTQDEVQKKSKKIQDAQLFEIHVVPVQFLDDIQNDQPWVVMEKLKISTWGILPHIRKQQAKDNAQKISTSRSRKSVPEKVSMILKDGAAIDPDSGK
ncbi:unnamed protein product [Rotaria sordida]|uniref:NAD(+) ADP-ribosyltransferase n=1 Tax=Rotaria sordida TaxID=392033 RepID=A0A814Q1U4_9BILA|nr:unnamed protein product [Rotaria sordida]